MTQGRKDGPKSQPRVRGASSMTRTAGFLLAALGLGKHAVRAQLYQLDGTAVPETKVLHTLYAFYVYSHADAPDKSVGSPFVKFHSLMAHSKSDKQSDESLETYTGLQLSILPYSDFWDLLRPTKFCSTQADVDAGVAAAANQLLLQAIDNGRIPETVYSHTVHFVADQTKRPKDVQDIVRTTGVYILIFSNCGDFFDATVTGSVIVKNAYGFLPGNEFHKMPFYGWLSVSYCVLAVVWFGLSLRFWRELIHIQNCITGVISLGLVEAFLWWIFFNDWNNSGIRGHVLFVLAIAFTVIKSIFSYMLVLVASLGWGVTRPYLDQRTILKIKGLAALYTVLDFIREAVLSFRHSHTLSVAFVLLCLMPVSILHGGMFYWIFTALSGLTETLRERRQTEKLLLFQRLWKILVLSMGFASLSMLWRIYDLSRSVSHRWHYQWLFADGVSHLIFLFVLVSMMFLWAPSSSQRYAYSHAAVKDDVKAKNAGDDAPAWAEEYNDDEEGDDESFWATTHGQAKTKPPSAVPESSDTFEEKF